MNYNVNLYKIFHKYKLKKSHGDRPEEDVDAVNVAWVQADWMSRLREHVLEQFRMNW